MSWRDERERRAAALLSAGMLLLAVQVVGAQEMIRAAGSVQWVSGTRMQTVELVETDQSSSRALRTGEPVVVDGVLSGHRRRIVAREVWRDSGSGYWSQSP